MTTLPDQGYRLEGISPKAYEHPADRAATAALGAIPYLDVAVRKLIDFGYERAMRQAYLGGSVRLSDDQLQDVWLAHVRAYKTLDIDPVPQLYLTTMPIPNAMTIGAQNPMVIVLSGTISLLDEPQLAAVFAHEAGHVLSDHVLYRTALQILLMLGAGLPLGLLPVRSALMEWFRASELSCDRAAALATRDPLSVCRALMAIAGGAEAHRLDLDAFMRQATEYREEGGIVEKLSRLLLDLNVTHALPVRRVHELMSWVRGGDYDRIVGGDYLRRDEPARPVREEFADAVNHYGERFSSFFQQAGQTVQQSLDELGDLLRRD